VVHKIQNVEIVPKKDALRALNLSADEFYGALATALDQLQDRPRRDLPGAHHIPLYVRGQPHPLGDLAQIEVR
jgi:hypothetical protein